MDIKNPLDWNLDDDKPNKKQIEAAKEKQYEEDIDFLKAFSTPAGKKVLAWMTLYTLDSPTWWPGKPPEFGYYREGQNHLVRQIRSKIENARNYQEKQK